MARTQPCRIDGILAAEANIAVIFRRGPNAVFQMLVWDLNTDTVTPGQWLTGKVFTERCDISPDGKHVVVFSRGYSVEPLGVNLAQVETLPARYWTTVCRPPFFSPIAVWATLMSYCGGGFWTSNESLATFKDLYIWDVILPPPPGLSVTETPKELAQDHSLPRRLERHGWSASELNWERECSQTMGRRGAQRVSFLAHSTNPIVSLAKTFLSGTIQADIAQSRQYWSLRDATGKERLGWARKENHPQWVDIDQNGRIVFGDRGCLWAWADFPNGKPSLIADLTANRYEEIMAPAWANEW